MVFSKEDLGTIKLLHESKRWGAKRIANFFPEKNWNVRTLSNVNFKIAAKCNLLVLNVGIMIEKVCSGCNSRDLNHLRETLTAEWDKLSQDVIDAAVAQFRPRLRACIANAGGHFEHQFN